MAVGAGVYVSNLAEVRKYLRKIHPDLVPVLREDLKSAIILNTLPASSCVESQRFPATPASQ
jgi:hypothetical protein